MLQKDVLKATGCRVICSLKTVCIAETLVFKPGATSA